MNCYDNLLSGCATSHKNWIYWIEISVPIYALQALLIRMKLSVWNEQAKRNSVAKWNTKASRFSHRLHGAYLQCKNAKREMNPKCNEMPYRINNAITKWTWSVKIHCVIVLYKFHANVWEFSCISAYSVHIDIIMIKMCLTSCIFGVSWIQMVHMYTWLHVFSSSGMIPKIEYWSCFHNFEYLFNIFKRAAC